MKTYDILLSPLCLVGWLLALAWSAIIPWSKTGSILWLGCTIAVFLLCILVQRLLDAEEDTDEAPIPRQAKPAPAKK